MGTTIWVLSKGKTTETDDWDHSALFYAVEKLDLVCDQIGLTKISEFLDWTDFEANMFEEDDFPDEEVLRDKASWFNPSTALPMLRAVREYVVNNGADGESLLEKGKEYLAEDLLDDLDDCIAKVEKIETEGDLFHFCVVM
jgi:hypothetical protein